MSSNPTRNVRVYMYTKLSQCHNANGCVWSFQLICMHDLQHTKPQSLNGFSGGKGTAKKREYLSVVIKITNCKLVKKKHLFFSQSPTHAIFFLYDFCSQQNCIKFQTCFKLSEVAAANRIEITLKSLPVYTSNIKLWRGSDENGCR